MLSAARCNTTICRLFDRSCGGRPRATISFRRWSLESFRVTHFRKRERARAKARDYMLAEYCRANVVAGFSPRSEETENGIHYEEASFTANVSDGSRRHDRIAFSGIHGARGDTARPDCCGREDSHALRSDLFPARRNDG